MWVSINYSIKVNCCLYIGHWLTQHELNKRLTECLLFIDYLAVTESGTWLLFLALSTLIFCFFISIAGFHRFIRICVRVYILHNTSFLFARVLNRRSGVCISSSFQTNQQKRWIPTKWFYCMWSDKVRKLKTVADCVVDINALELLRQIKQQGGYEKEWMLLCVLLAWAIQRGGCWQTPKWQFLWLNWKL